MTKIYQIFIGCPFAQEVRGSYDRLRRELEQETPLHVVLADTVSVSSSDYLLAHITDLIRESAGCIFDVTGANPNVSLEVGIAHTIPVNFILTLKSRKPKKDSEQHRVVRSIISDLQGKPRFEYKIYRGLKDQLVSRYLNDLPYMKRWLAFKKENDSMAPYVLKLFADLRSSARSTSPRLAAILEGSGFKTTDVTRELVRMKLVHVRAGRDGGYFYPSK